MRRALPALIATLGALLLLANFHTASGARPRVPVAAATSTAPAAGGGPPPSPTGSSTTNAVGSGGSRQIDGPVVATQFGDVQVRVIIDNGKITDVQPLQLPFDRRHSQELSQEAAPLLHDEVLRSQSAQIDLISGATYTSQAYAQSLQAALDQTR